jgi:hypothetical protein
MTGALTGIRAVISPKQLITDEMTRIKIASALFVSTQAAPNSRLGY